jgi:protein-tyrosine phosphatase
LIDIHCHILPYADDGAETEEHSFEMARLAQEEGIHTIVATPHYNRIYQNYRGEIIEKVHQLNKSLKEKDIPLTVYPGQELRITGGILEDIDQGHILTLNDNGKYLFIEFPSREVPRYTRELLYKIQLRGIIPIIVHPERNAELIEKPDLLYELVSGGILTQVTAASLAGSFGKKVQKFSLNLIEHALTHFIASDAHNISNRAFNFHQAYHVMELKFGAEKCDQFKKNSELVLTGKEIISDEPTKVRKKWMGIF